MTTHMHKIIIEKETGDILRALRKPGYTFETPVYTMDGKQIIDVSDDVLEALNAAKVRPNESYDAVILRNCKKLN